MHIMNINKVRRDTCFLALISNLELTWFGATILLSLHWNQWNIQRYPKHYESLQTRYILANHGRSCQRVINVVKSLLKITKCLVTKQIASQQFSKQGVCVRSKQNISLLNYLECRWEGIFTSITTAKRK